MGEISIGKRKFCCIEAKTDAGNMWIKRQYTLAEIEFKTGVPQTTIRRSAETILKKGFIQNVGRPPRLSANDEAALASWARWCVSCRLPRTRQLICLQASKIAQYRNLPKTEFGMKWFRLFKARHKLIMRKARRTEILPPTVKEFNDFMSEFKRQMEKHHVSNIWNADETGTCHNHFATIDMICTCF